MRAAQRRSRGFTLVELMVSLVAGLIVTLAVVGIARAATKTFYEAARMSSTEATVRAASERLRQDLSRAGYMSTGNIRLARDGQSSVTLRNKIAVRDPTSDTTGARYPGLQNLQGLHIVVGGSGNFPIANAGTQGPNNLSTNNGLNPDAITLGGNFTTDDSYAGIYSTSGGSCGGAQSVVLNAAGDAAVRRLLQVSAPLASLQAAFYPSNVDTAARIVDARGCQHYAAVTGVSFSGTTGTICLRADTSGNPAVLDGGSTACGAKDTEPVTINPVQTVRWYIGPNLDTTLNPTTGTEVAGNKFNLYRDFLDATSTQTPIPGTRQIIAEFAVDLKFGIVALDNLNTMKVFDMESEAGGGTGPIEQYTQNASGTVFGGPAPQRVRSVRYRIATRTALADRDQNLPGPATTQFITRYCVQGVPAAGGACKQFARVRTLVSEVALLNQMGMMY